MFLFSAVTVAFIIKYYRHGWTPRKGSNVASTQEATLACQRHWGEAQTVWWFQIWWLLKIYLYIADMWNVCISLRLTAQTLFMLDELFCSSCTWVFGRFQSYIMPVNMQTTLQINLQTDGKSRVWLAGMFLSWQHGIKVSSGMWQSSRTSPAQQWSAWLEDTEVDGLTM